MLMLIFQINIATIYSFTFENQVFIGIVTHFFLQVVGMPTITLLSNNQCHSCLVFVHQKFYRYNRNAVCISQSIHSIIFVYLFMKQIFSLILYTTFSLVNFCVGSE